MEFITELSLDSKFIRGCDIPPQPSKIEPLALVIFGGAGDLAGRKLMPMLFNLYLQGELPERFAILGAGVPELEDAAYRVLMAEACRTRLGGAFAADGWERFSQSVFHQGGAFDDPGTFTLMRDRIAALRQGCDSDVIHYFAVPPDIAPLIVDNLKLLKMCGDENSVKVIVEEPFGRDRVSAAALNRVLRAAYPESSICRIDHCLGKETVQNIVFFRFYNTIFEQPWNSRYVENVQITVAESQGVEHRAAFYERTGVVRDILQNHLLQLVALVAMAPPIGFEADLIRDKKMKFFRPIRPLDEASTDAGAVRGQHAAGESGRAAVAGYREEPGIPMDSLTPTFVATRLAFANWRWAGVPFYVRTGKRLARRVTEICIQFASRPCACSAAPVTCSSRT